MFKFNNKIQNILKKFNKMIKYYKNKIEFMKINICLIKMLKKTKIIFTINKIEIIILKVLMKKFFYFLRIVNLDLKIKK